MAYRYGNRNQIRLFPESMEDYIAPGDPVRAYDAFIGALDFRNLGITLDSNKVGNSEYHPQAMLKLLVYGYSYGIRSSRKLERATHHNLSFVWLTSGLKPDHKTIAEFRRKNKEALAQVLKQCAKICIKLNLIEGNTLFLDGTKIRANASINNTWTREKAQKALKNIDKNIKDILTQCDKVDDAEKGLGSLVTMDKELKDQKILQSKVENILKELQEDKSLNTTDPDCIRIKKGRNFHAGFNFQSVVDEKEGLILSVDVVSENNDLNQFASQINQVNHTLNKKCEVAVADCGYASTDDLEKIDNQGIKVIVPSQRQVTKKEPSLFAKEHFTYQDDYYTCPHYGNCTKSPTGRTISRLLKEEVRQKLEAQYNEPSSQEIYKLRKEKVELPYVHSKYNLKFDSFLLRGLKGVKAEASIIGTCFNLFRMITLLGVPGLVKELNAC